MNVLVVGSGAGGAMAARHLALSGVNVTVLEAGGAFKPLTRKVRHAEPLRRVGLLGSERTITKLFPSMITSRSGDLVMVRGICAGGCTTLSCGNMMPTDRGLKEIGLDLGPEFQEIGALVSTCTVPRERWTRTTAKMFDVAEGMGLKPRPTDKALDLDRCASCGMCELGCARGARWDSNVWLEEAAAHGARVLLGHEVIRARIDNGKVTGVDALAPSGEISIKADRVVLAAGGVGTAQVLQRSGVQVSDTLWTDPVITIGGSLPNARQLEEVPMVWYGRGRDHMLSPYLDLLSHYFHPAWRGVGIRDRVGLMVKLADSSNGRVGPDGGIEKVLTEDDERTISEAVSTVEGIMAGANVSGPFVQGMINGGHLGGTFPLRPGDAGTMRPDGLPEGLWVADLSLAPRSQGAPTMMLAAALSLRVSKKVMESVD